MTCPWHRYQYRLEDGCAPPPFTEKLVTYRVRIAHDVVQVDPRPLPPGTLAAMRYEGNERDKDNGGTAISVRSLPLKDQRAVREIS